MAPRFFKESVGNSSLRATIAEHACLTIFLQLSFYFLQEHGLDLPRTFCCGFFFLSFMLSAGEYVLAQVVVLDDKGPRAAVVASFFPDAETGT